MVRNNIARLILLPLLFLFIACVREVWPEERSGEVVIPFSTPAATEVVVSTKGTVDGTTESQVNNLYVFVFDSNKEKIYGQYFDASNKDRADLPDYWTNSDIHITTLAENPANSYDRTIVVIANFDEKMVNISPEQLGMIESLDEITELTASLNQQVISRGGFFPMSAIAEKVNTTGPVKKKVGESEEDVVLTLQRLDAKIFFKVRADNTTTNNNTSLDIVSFTPVSWQVVNVPKFSYVLPAAADAASQPGDYFDGLETVFETETIPDKPSGKDTRPKYTSGKVIPTHGFSFYMMENRKTPNTPTGEWTYAHRELQNKDGAGNLTGGFVYANDLSSYVIIKGQLITKDGSSTRTSNVQYVIHLGDFSGNKFDKFDVERNHSYTYNIYIKGVNDIYVEVHGKDDGEGHTIYPEDEPGAEGDILISEATPIICDSHYSSHSIVFTQGDISSDRMNWWVQTPFNPDGADATTVGNVDCEWVEFRVNVDQKDNNGKYLLNKWTTYQPRTKAGCKYDRTKAIGENYSPTMTIGELMDLLGRDDAPFIDGKMVVTAFVNEYYYEKNPITGQFEKDLWRRFVDQEARTMCILANIESSADGKSHVINSSFTIQQYAIQSVYNINNYGFNSAWGSEYLNDVRESKCTSYVKPNPGSEARGNTDLNNGRLNSMIEWGLRTSSDPKYMGDGLQWSQFLNLMDDDESLPLMNTSYKVPNTNNTESYAYLRYSCLSRNRDNNGDGHIDKDEVRWYMATSNQLIGLFLGSYGIEGGARLYQRPKESWNKNNKDTWRQHVVGSNVNFTQGTNSNLNVRVVWSEEGMTGSDLSWGIGNWDQTTEFSVRCVRNIGYDSSTGKDITFSDESKVPDPLIVVTRKQRGSEGEFKGEWNNNIYFDIDCSRVNERSLRYYTDRELVSHDENSDAACLYKRFVTTTVSESESMTLSTSRGIAVINNNIDSNYANFQEKYCPEGYRLPNVREVAILSYFIPLASDAKSFVKSSNTILSRTYFSFGVRDPGGLNYTTTPKPENTHWGWRAEIKYSAVKASMAATSVTTKVLRCVKDVKVD